MGVSGASGTSSTSCPSSTSNTSFPSFPIATRKPSSYRKRKILSDSYFFYSS